VCDTVLDTVFNTVFDTVFDAVDEMVEEMMEDSEASVDDNEAVEDMMAAEERAKAWAVPCVSQPGAFHRRS
jgi:hypothetical protein